jgi:hypothetical protein
MKPMYLVQLVHAMDDLPVYRTESKPAALKFAKNLKAMPTKKVRDLFQTDCAMPVCSRIVTFNAQGQPAKVELVKDFTK